MDIDRSELSILKVTDPAEADRLLELMRRAMMLYARETGIPLYRKDGSYTLASLNETRGDIVEAMRNEDFLGMYYRDNWIASARLIRDDQAHKALFTRFCVEPQLRNQGLGALLLESCCDYLAKGGIRELYLYTAQENSALLNFYKHHGFFLYSVNNGKPYPKVCMLRELY